MAADGAELVAFGTPPRGTRGVDRNVSPAAAEDSPLPAREPDEPELLNPSALPQAEACTVCAICLCAYRDVSRPLARATPLSLQPRPVLHPPEGEAAPSTTDGAPEPRQADVESGPDEHVSLLRTAPADGTSPLQARRGVSFASGAPEMRQTPSQSRPLRPVHLRCGHTFHAACVSEWSRKGGELRGCPICRAPMQCDAEEEQFLLAELAGPRGGIQWQHYGMAARPPDTRPRNWGRRWHVKQIISNLLMHFGYPLALFAGSGTIIYLVSGGLS